MSGELIVILVNGPGEVSGHAVPLIRALKKHSSGDIAAFVLPCPYASGSEEIYLRKEEIDVYKATGLKGFVSSAWNIAKKTRIRLVIQVGGDVIFGISMKRVAKCPLWIYTFAGKSGINYADKILIPYDGCRMYFSSKNHSKLSVVGNLQVDEISEKMGLPVFSRDKPKGILYLIGSRPKLIPGSLFFAISVISFLHETGAEHLISLSPFLGEREKEFVKKTVARIFDGKEKISITEKSLYELYGSVKIALTGPGTNNMELAALGIPGVVAIPEEIVAGAPLGGIWGMLSKIAPSMTYPIKIHALNKIIKKFGFLTWPNRLSGKELFKELYGANVSPGATADQLQSLLNDDQYCDEISEELIALAGSSGASEKIAIMALGSFA